MLTLVLLVVVLVAVAALERWERMRVQGRYLSALDQHAAVLVEIARAQAGGAGPPSPPPPPAEIQLAPSLESLAEERAVAAAIQRGKAQILRESQTSGAPLTPEEAEDIARELLSQLPGVYP